MSPLVPSSVDLLRVAPELIWCFFGMLCMLAQPFVRNRHVFTFLALAGTGFGTLSVLLSGSNGGPAFFGLIATDTFATFFHVLVGCVAFLVVLAADPYLDRERLEPAEFFALLLFATAGM